MKPLAAIIRPERVSDVLEVFFRAYVNGLTISRAHGHGAELEMVETYRGTTVKMELVVKVWPEIGVSDHFVEPTIAAIVHAARTGEVGDGNILVMPVERMVGIRNGARDTEAAPAVIPTPSSVSPTTEHAGRASRVMSAV